jgi:hypothetical protein
MVLGALFMMVMKKPGLLDMGATQPEALENLKRLDEEYEDASQEAEWCYETGLY